MPSIVHFSVDALTSCSDHCPLSLDLKTNSYSPFQLSNLLKGSKELLDKFLRSNGLSNDPYKTPTPQLRVKWNTELEQALQREFSDNGFIAKLSSLGSQVDNMQVDDCVSKFEKVLQDTLHKYTSVKCSANKRKPTPFQEIPGLTRNARQRKAQ